MHHDNPDELDDESKFWIPQPGANYVIRIDHVLYAWGQDVNDQHYLTFLMVGGHQFQVAYPLEQRDAALRLFCDFVGAGRTPAPVSVASG